MKDDKRNIDEKTLSDDEMAEVTGGRSSEIFNPQVSSRIQMTCPMCGKEISFDMSSVNSMTNGESGEKIVRCSGCNNRLKMIYDSASHWWHADVVR